MIGNTDKTPQLKMDQVPLIQFIYLEHQQYQLAERMFWMHISSRTLNK